MNTVVVKQTIKQRLQAIKDEQMHQYHLTHDCFTGRPLSAYQLAYSYEETVDVSVQKQQRDLDSLNKVLYPKPTLANVLGDSLAALKLTPEISESAAQLPLSKPSVDLLHRTKLWFDTYCTEGLESLLPAQSSQLSEANIALIKRVFSRNTVLIQNVCILSAFWIRSPQDWNEKGSTGLLEHLFVQYGTPAFLRACWSNALDEQNVRWLLCYVFYAQGGSLKALASYFGWMTASSKLWHELYACPAGISPLHAVLCAEFKRLGGWAEDFACLMANESYVIDLLEPVSEEGRDFWYDTCRWTISRQFELTPEQNRKVLWWARHQLTEHARRGRGESYRLQGRSTAKVLESIAVYENEQRQFQLARVRLAERARQVSTAREEERTRLRTEHEQEQAAREALLAQQNGDYYDYEQIDVNWRSRGWNWTTTAHGKQWHFVELTSSQELYDEGEAMEHCVGGYSLNCLEGDSAIFSLSSEGHRKVTIEVDPLCKHLIEVLGQYNAEPARSVQSVVDSWMKRVVKS